MTIETYQPASPVVAGTTGANLIREAAAVMVDAHKLATAVASTQMIPKHFQGKPDECAAAMLYGASLGLDPMQSVRQIYVVHGQAALYARAMVSLVLGHGHEVWTIDSTDEAVTVGGRRRGSQHVEQSTWTFERAKKAGYTNNEKYRSDPQAMLYSKAASEVCRKIAPDVLSGVYAVEEMQMERVESERIDRPASASATDRLRASLNPSPAPDDVVSSEPVGSSSSPATESGVQASAGEAPGITPGQLKKMGAAMRERGLTERTDALDFVNAVIGREVDSRNDLTRDEAGAVIDALEDWSADAEQPTEDGAAQ